MHVWLPIFMNSWVVVFLDRRGTGWICVLLRCKHLWSTLCVGTAWHMCPFPPHTEMMNRWVSVCRAAVRELAHTSSHTAEAFAGSARTKRDYPQLKRRIALEKKINSIASPACPRTKDHQENKSLIFSRAKRRCLLVMNFLVVTVNCLPVEDECTLH